MKANIPSVRVNSDYFLNHFGNNNQVALQSQITYATAHRILAQGYSPTVETLIKKLSLGAGLTRSQIAELRLGDVLLLEMPTDAEAA